MAPRRYFYQSGQMVPIARLFAMGFYSTIWPLPKKTRLRIQEMMYRINNNPGEERVEDGRDALLKYSATPPGILHLV